MAVQNNWSEPQSFGGRLAAVVGQPDSNIAVVRNPFWIERPAALSALTAEVESSGGLCSVVGMGGVGKSTLALLYAYQCQQRMLVRWLPSQDAGLLQLGFEQIGKAVGLDFERVPGRGGTDPAKYRKELARFVYHKLT